MLQFVVFRDAYAYNEALVYELRKYKVQENTFVLHLLLLYINIYIYIHTRRMSSVKISIYYIL